MNTIFIGDNLNIMQGMNSKSIDLIYLDPPFNSNRNYEGFVKSKAEESHFKDTWTLNDVDLYEYNNLENCNPVLYKIINAIEEIHSKSMKSYLIFMAIRLLEMRRILKLTGSIYLHCDSTASHYLKLLMDSIFGKNNCCASITWKRSHSHNDKMFGAISDHILYYSLGSPIRNLESVIVPFPDVEIKKKYPCEDEKGRYMRDNLTGPGISSGESGQPWEGYDPGVSGRCWSVPRTGRYARHLHETLLPGYLNIEGIHDRLNALNKANMIHWSKNGVPNLKRYFVKGQGTVPGDIWTDINLLSPTSKERIGYPTQKPIALLERIIKASSNPGDIVLDPFCGSGTTLIAANKLNRKWIGCDSSEEAIKCVEQRLKDINYEMEGTYTPN